MTDEEVVPLTLKEELVYEAPICTNEFEIGIGELLAILEFTTTDDARLRVPIPLAAMRELATTLMTAVQATRGDQRGKLQ